MLAPPKMLSFAFGLVKDGTLVLYSGGRPTSVVLLFLVVVSKLALPLSRHSSLRLYHLLCLVGSARRLVSLGRVEVLQARSGVTVAVTMRRSVAVAAVALAVTVTMAVAVMAASTLATIVAHRWWSHAGRS
jgi:hypothetical protein